MTVTGGPAAAPEGPSMISLAGAWTALVTPFSSDGLTVDLDRLDAAIRAQALAGIDGVVACGTTGEAPTLSRDEWDLVVARTIETARTEGLRVMVGAGSYDTRTAIALHRRAADLGADAALHVCPYYNRPSAEGLRRHFQSVADSADLPVVLYDIPGRTGVRLTLETIHALAAHPRIVAIKDATGGLETAMGVLAETDLEVLGGDDPLTLPLMALGAGGVISVLGNLEPGRVARLVRLMQEGRLAEAREVHLDLLPLARGLLLLGPNPVPVKAALARLGRDSGVVRPPLVRLEVEAEATLAALLEARAAAPSLPPMAPAAT
jgi:4-hydroxy-tetrahydrodipicolinate synthase